MYLVGNVICALGAALWLYGYFVTGHPALLDWASFSPHWIYAYIPNLEAEIGLAACVAGSVLAIMPKRR
jgi:hypothetical protein